MPMTCILKLAIVIAIANHIVKCSAVLVTAVHTKVSSSVNVSSYFILTYFDLKLQSAILESIYHVCSAYYFCSAYYS